MWVEVRESHAAQRCDALPGAIGFDQQINVAQKAFRGIGVQAVRDTGRAFEQYYLDPDFIQANKNCGETIHDRGVSPEILVPDHMEVGLDRVRDGGNVLDGAPDGRIKLVFLR